MTYNMLIRRFQIALTFCFGVLLMYKEVSLIIAQQRTDVYELDDPWGYWLRPTWAIFINIFCSLSILVISVLMYKKRLKQTIGGILTFILLFVNLLISFWW